MTSAHPGRRRRSARASSQRAAGGASGIATTGSQLLALEESARQGEIDALAIRHGGAVESSRFASSAAISRAEGSAALTTSQLQAGTSLLSLGKQR